MHTRSSDIPVIYGDEMRVLNPKPEYFQIGALAKDFALTKPRRKPRTRRSVRRSVDNTSIYALEL
jgi:hypothetical protein